MIARTGRKSARNSLHFDGLTLSICKTSPFFYFACISALGPGKTSLTVERETPRNSMHFECITPSFHSTSPFFILRTNFRRPNPGVDSEALAGYS
ncbi:MAG: hypothetical protein WBX09_19765 [Terracidiphilus sp.]